MGAKICTLDCLHDSRIVKVRKNVQGMTLSSIHSMMEKIVNTFLKEHLIPLYPSCTRYSIQDATIINHSTCEIVIEFDNPVNLSHEKLLRLYRVV